MTLTSGVIREPNSALLAGADAEYPELVDESGDGFVRSHQDAYRVTRSGGDGLSNARGDVLGRRRASVRGELVSRPDLERHVPWQLRSSRRVPFESAFPRARGGGVLVADPGVLVDAFKEAIDDVDDDR